MMGFFLRWSRRLPAWVAGALVLAATASVPARAQTALSPSPARIEKVSTADPIPTTVPATPGVPDSGIVQTGCGGCSGCGQGYGALCGPGVLGSGQCGACCYPGKNFCCSDCEHCTTKVGRFCCGLYQCICCPDPCYDPCWQAVADQAFFLDAARPISQTKLRYDSVWNYRHPDRAEYFWARQLLNPNQVAFAGGPAINGAGKNLVRSVPVTRIEYQALTMYVEAASGGFGATIETTYLNLTDLSNGFGDLTIGTKSMFLDCELLQLTFGFKTFVPTGNFTKGLGTGHVTLEPSLLFNIKCSPKTYLQGQFAYGIPLGGDGEFQASVFHMHFSLNHILWCPCPGVQLIGNVEVNEWSVQDGFFTEQAGNVNLGLPARNDFVSAGPGVRLILCDKVDFGIGSQFAITDQHFAGQQLRAEFRLRY